MPYAALMRKERLISLSLPLNEWLVKKSKSLGISVSELIRRVLDAEKEKETL